MARWDRNRQDASAHGRRGRRAYPQRNGPRQSGKAALSDGESASLNRIGGRDALTSRPADGAGFLAPRGRVSTGRLVNAPAILDGRAGRNPFSPGPPRLSGEHPDAIDSQQTLYIKIVQEWTTTLTGPFDWADWPLDRFVFGEAFHQPLKHLRNLDYAAWLCAMVACGLAHEFPELDVQPTPVESDGGLPARKDGAEGYRCTIVSGRSAGSRLDFWRLPSGVIEFTSFTAMRLVRASTDMGSDTRHVDR